MRSTASAEAALVVVEESDEELASEAMPVVTVDESVLKVPLAVKAPVAEVEITVFTIVVDPVELTALAELPLSLEEAVTDTVVATVDPLRYEGAATADEASTRDPVPH